MQWAQTATHHKIFSSVQKGFVHGLTGCTEHSLLVNELFADARGKQKSIIAAQIDFTNAFGSVPHRLFLQNLEDLGFPPEFVELVEDLYTGASSVISLPTGDTEPIPWMSGVKQSCPLSPLLFNICVEPLLRKLQTMRHLGYKAETKYLGEQININVLAYADDLILISETEEGMSALLEELSRFCEFSLMEVNPAKGVTVSSVWFPEGG
jgi:hypothetical protein